MNSIEYIDFKNNNYDIKGISNYKLVKCFCYRCKNPFEYSQVKTFIKHRKNYPKELWECCQKCFHLISTSENKNWIEKNRQAQLIAQNTSEQKKKNSNGVSKSWNEKRKEEASKYLKERWKNDDIFKNKALENLSWTQSKNILQHPVFKKSICLGGHKGIYKNIEYQSSLELSFILYCLEEKIEITRCHFGIDYIDENKKSRVYYPDFIINSNKVVEIKGYGIYYNKYYKRNICKNNAIEEFCKNNNYEYSIFFQDHEFVRKNYNKARKLHNENKKENSI